MKGGVFLEKSKKPVIKFDPNSNLPVLFYAIAAVILSCIFIIITLFTTGFNFTISRELSSGDLNNDGNHSASDALYIMQRNQGKINFNGAQIDAADVNKDGVINDLDATLIVQYASGTSKKLGILAIGNTTMEKPSSGTKSTSAQAVSAQETNFVSTGKSYAAAFFTSENNVYTTAKIANKWQSNGKYYYQVDIVFKNNSGQYIGDSTVELDFSNDVTVEKSWKCSAADSDFGLNISTQSYSYIPDGGTLKCGLIVSSPSEVEIDSVSK